MPNCPACGKPARTETSQCRTCGLSLTGSAVGQLWQVDQQMAQLAARRKALIDQLGSCATTTDPRLTPDPPSTPEGRGRPAQQVLLVVGVLLVMVAALVFVAVSWSALGAAGQVVAVTTAAVGCAAASRLLSRRHLTPRRKPRPRSVSGWWPSAWLRLARSGWPN